MATATRLQHGRLSIQLHPLSTGNSPDYPPLLLLHALGSSAAQWGDPSHESDGSDGSDKSDRPMDWSVWRGPVHALDFAGHGQSDRVVGRCYFPELFLLDADEALAALGGRAYLAGEGVGAYVALLLAGARPEGVPAALLLPGCGLGCGGDGPDFERPPESIEAWEERVRTTALGYSASADPDVATCEQRFRPPDYVSDFASKANRLLFSQAVDPEAVDGGSLAWWRTAKESSKGESAPADLAVALRQLAP